MAIDLITGFNISTSDPVDTRIVVADATARKALGGPAFEGLIVYETGSNQLYILVDAANKANDSGWLKIADGSGTITGYSGSFSGSFQGDGAGLTNVPASGIVGLNLSRVATGSVTASADVGATSFSIESGSTTLMSVKPDGRIAVSQSINVGTPVANQWGTDLDGSYFNNFTSNTDVSTMLRFIAGLLSQSAPDASPNTRTWNNTTASFSVGNTTGKTAYMSGVLGGASYKAARLSQEWDQSTFISSSATSSYRELQSYLISKGWLDSSETGSNVLHDVGTNPFGTGSYGVNIPSNIYNTFGTFTFNASSGVTGTTVFSSSLGARAFGLGNLIDPNTVTPYSVNIIYTQSFSDTASVVTPSITSTYSTSSGVTYTRSAVGNSNGLYLGLISTVNPKVIPNAYQDGYFLNSPANVGGRKWDSLGTSGNVTSSIGYYRLHGLSVGLSSSQAEGFITKSIVPSTSTVGFYAPSLNTLGVQDITLSPPTVTLSNNVNIASFTATSRSLSGAPYISSSAYTITYDTEVSKSFDPCYAFSTSPISITKTDSWTASGSVTYTPPTISVTSNGIQTNTANAGVFPAGSDPSNRRSINAIPAIGDVAFLSSSYSFTLTANKSNVVQNKATQAAANLSLTFRTTGRNWKNTTATLDSSTLQFYDATRFGQPSDSGSMAIYSRAQTYDGSTLTGTTENFTGESNRIQVSSSGYQVTAFNGAPWDTSTAYYNLGDKELQIKPGFLVKPGGTYGYWITNPSTASDYKYYIRRFKRTVNVNSMRITVNQDLSLWSSTTNDSVAMAIIFESARSGSSDVGFGNCRLYDVAQGGGSAGTTYSAGTDGTNPFETDVDFYRAGSKLASSTGIYDVAISNANGIFMDGSANRDEFYIIVRYKGDPSPLTGITLTYTG